MGKEKKYFAAGGEALGFCNADDDAFVIGQNQWVNASNFRVGSTDKGVTGVLESIGGTRRLSTPSPSVNFINIGKVVDTTGRRIIEFLYNLHTSQHKIQCWSYDDNTMYLMLLSSQVDNGLNFNKNKLIHGTVVNGVVYWTDNYNAPRKLNIDAAIKANQPTYNTTQSPYTFPLERTVITIARKPPEISLQVVKITLGTVSVNNVADFAGFFAWRYTFRDNETSVLSPVSERINYNTAGQNFDAVAIVANDIYGFPNHIDQDVQTVDFCVRYGKDPSFFIIKTWDKRIPADALAIANHNAGILSLNYTFLNDRLGIALSDAYSVKPFDSIPRISETIETGLNRLFLGNNLESFNSPTTTSLSGVLVSPTPSPTYQNPSFKSGGNYQVGIIFRDEYKRVIGNVLTNDSLKFVIPKRDYNDTTYYTHIALTLSNTNAVNEIPKEAYFYEYVITKNLKTRFFLQAKSGGTKYALKDPTTGVFSYQDAYTANAFGIAFNASYLNAAGMGYKFEEGDIMEIIQSASATQYSLAVVGQDGDYIISKLENLGNLSSQPDLLFEIYTPYKPTASEPFYTIGETHKVVNPTQPSRTYGSLGGIIPGDIYRQVSGIAPVGYNAENMSPIAKFWKEWVTNSGEANFVLNSIETQKYTAVRWSNVIIDGSQTNGLSTFDALDEKILPLDLGKLRKLQNTSKVEEQGNVMLAIGEQETASCYLGEVQLVGAAQNAFVASAPNVIGTVNVLKGNFGTRNPESVVEYRGQVYWLDINNGRIIQYSTNGLFPISNYKMTRFWKNWSEKFLSMTAQQIEIFGGRPFVFSEVDPFHNELLFSIPQLGEPPKGYLADYRVEPPTPDTQVYMVYPFDILDFQGKTIVYNLEKNAWTGSYSFNPEGFAAIQNNLYSFKDGQTYIHNQSDNQCNFYDIQYTSKIMPVSNMFPSIPKSYNATSVESNKPPVYVLLYNDYPYIQESDLVDTDFTGNGEVPNGLEGIWSATFYRNIIQPTASGFTATSRLTGERMRSVAMFFMYEFAPTGNNVLNLKFINISFTESAGNSNV